MRSANAHPGGRGIARTDHRDHRQAQRSGIAADRKEWRRVVDHLQAERIVGLAQRDESDTERVCRRDLALRILAWIDPSGT